MSWVSAMAKGLREVAALPDPVVRILDERTRPNGLRLQKVDPPIGVVVIIWAIQIVASTWWLKHFLLGPAEWVWRSLTYWKLQPLHRNRAVASPSTAG